MPKNWPIYRYTLNMPAMNKFVQLRISRYNLPEIKRVVIFLSLLIGRRQNHAKAIILLIHV